MNPAYAGNWYSFEKIVEITGWSERTVRTKLSAAPDQLVRQEPQAMGRPRNLYHYTVCPQVAAWHAMHAEARGQKSEVTAVAVLESAASVPSVVSSLPSSVVPSSVSSSGPAADDLAIAELRLKAVKDYLAAAEIFPAAQAEQNISQMWARVPQTRSIRVVERLNEYQRKSSQTISLGGFAPKTLRRWVSIYRKAQTAGRSEAQALLNLAPERKGHVGRRRVQIPAEAVEFVRMLAVSTCRADVAKAVEKARAHLPEELRELSLDTWRRRIREADPRKAGRDLMHSISRYRQKHSPDVEIDWSQLPYNGRWEIDDVQKDWYALGTELSTTLRPFGYAIIRVRTRQWVAFAASETRPTQAQVRELIGFALCNPAGGIPAEFKFERGAVACTPDLEQLLLALGVRVSRTSMDSGHAITGLVDDVGKGHFQGKGVIESNLRRNHNLEWDKPGQVGPDERETAPARTERIKALAVAAAQRGEVGLVLPGPDTWYATFLETMERHNNTPHGGLPEIIDATGARRHMTPNEMAITLKDEPVSVMDARLLPRFVAQAQRVPVTRNGFVLNTHCYGRFEEDLQKFGEVTVFASRDYPLVAYVQELGRCVEIYEKAAPGDYDQFGMKRRLESKFRNEHEALAARVLSNPEKRGIFDALLMARNPTPERLVAATVCPEPMLAQASGLASGIEASRAAQETADARFSRGSQLAAHTSEAPRSERRSGLLARAQDLADQVDMLSGETPA